MALFDDENIPDHVEKSRLFDTIKGEDASSFGYLKHLLPVVLVVGLIGAGMIYFYLPGVGDEVNVPTGLDVALNEYFLKNEKRPVTESAYFYCKDFYWVRVVLERRADVTARQLDAGHRRAIAAENGNGSWTITSTPAAEGQADTPCTR